MTDHRNTSNASMRQWAKVPEWVAYKGLDATAWNVLIILAAKAGRDRVAWISHRTIAERLTDAGQPISGRGVGKAIGRLEQAEIVRQEGKVVVDREKGTWVKRYRILDGASEQPEGTVGVHSGIDVGGPDGTGEAPDGTLGGPDGTPGVQHSVPQYSVPQSPVSAFEEEEKQKRTEEEKQKWLQKVGSAPSEDEWRKRYFRGQGGRTKT